MRIKCGISGGQRGNGTGCSPTSLVSCRPLVIPPPIRIHSLPSADGTKGVQAAAAMRHPLSYPSRRHYRQDKQHLL